MSQTVAQRSETQALATENREKSKGSARLTGCLALRKHPGHVPGVSYEMMGRESAWLGDSFANRSTKHIDLAERLCASG